MASGVGRGRDEPFHGRFEVLRSDGFVGGGGAEGPRSTASMAGGRWQVAGGPGREKEEEEEEEAAYRGEQFIGLSRFAADAMPFQLSHS